MNTADYFALSSRANSYLHIAVHIAQYDGYLHQFVVELLHSKICHWVGGVFYHVIFNFVSPCLLILDFNAHIGLIFLAIRIFGHPNPCLTFSFIFLILQV